MASPPEELDAELCVVFDVDDTLFLEREYVRSGFNSVGEWVRDNLGYSGFAEEAWALFGAGRRGHIFDEVLEARGLGADVEVIGRMVQIYRLHRPAITLLDDARRCLETLVGKVPIAVVTDGPSASQRAKVGALGLARWTDVIVYTDELGAGLGKPHTAGFELVEAMSGRRSDQCVYVADNPLKDFGGPARLGWRTVRLRRSGSLHERVDSRQDVEFEWTDLDILPGWILDQ